MKRLGMFIILAVGLAMGVAQAKLNKTVVTGAIGSTSVTLSNANTIATYRVLGAYVELASNSLNAATITLKDGGVFVDSSTIASNTTGGVIDLSGVYVQQNLGNYVTVNRDSNAGTNGAWSVLFVTEQD